MLAILYKSQLMLLQILKASYPAGCKTLVAIFGIESTTHGFRTLASVNALFFCCRHPSARRCSCFLLAAGTLRFTSTLASAFLHKQQDSASIAIYLQLMQGRLYPPHAMTASRSPRLYMLQSCAGMKCRVPTLPPMR